MGTTTDDAEQVASQTRYITGLPVERGGSGDPSPMTAWGVVCGIRAALAEAGTAGGLDGVRVAVQGAGHVGGAVAGHLLAAGRRGHGGGHPRGQGRAAARAGGAVAAADEIHQVECDVYSPCALGAVIRPETIGRLRCRVVAGAANNQLADASMGDELKRRGIVYAPDFAINAGGVINIADELIGDGYDPDRAKRSVERIEQTLRDVFERARSAGVAPNRAARADGTGADRRRPRRAARALIPLTDNIPTRSRPVVTHGADRDQRGGLPVPDGGAGAAPADDQPAGVPGRGPDRDPVRVRLRAVRASPPAARMATTRSMSVAGRTSIVHHVRCC